MIGEGLYLLDGVDMYSTYGAAILKGSYNSLFAYPTAKEPLQNDWFEYDGLDVDLSERFFDPLSVNIQFVVVSRVGVADLVAKRDALNTVLRSAGYRDLYLSGMQTGLQLRYISSNGGDVGTVATNKQIYSLEFTATFSMDDPMQLFTIGTERVFDSTFDDTFGASGRNFAMSLYKYFIPETVFIDSVTLRDYGIAVRSFGGSALEVDNSKNPLYLTYERLTGAEADCSTVQMKRASKELKLALTIGADSAATALNNYCSFFLALTAAEKRVLTSTLYGKSFDCYYASQSNLEMYGMRRESTYCFIDFEITLKTIN